MTILSTSAPSHRTRSRGARLRGGLVNLGLALVMLAALGFLLPSLMGLQRYVIMGGFLGFGPDVEVIVDKAPEGKYGHRELLLMDDMVVGGTFLGDRRHYLAYRQLMQTRVKVTEFKDRLLDADFDPNLARPPGNLDYYFF